MSNIQALTYKYCPRCGKDLVYKSDYILKCSSCNLNFFQSFKPASSVILVTPDGRLLTAIRAIEPKKGTWDFPGGFTALDENLEEGISREMKEELNLSLAPSRFNYLGSFLEKYPYQDILYDVLIAFFYANISEEDIKNIKPADDVASFELKNHDELDHSTTTWQSNLDALELYLKSLKK